MVSDICREAGIKERSAPFLRFADLSAAAHNSDAEEGNRSTRKQPSVQRDLSLFYILRWQFRQRAIGFGRGTADASSAFRRYRQGRLCPTGSYRGRATSIRR